MRAASILLALVVVLGLPRDAISGQPYLVHDYSVVVGHHLYGVIDWPGEPESNTQPFTTAYFGPLGQHQVPFTATEGLVGFCVVVVGLVALVTVGTVRWKRAAQK